MVKERSGTEGWGLRTKAPLGVEYQWIDMLIYGVLMMTYTLMAMDVDNEGVWRAPIKHQASQVAYRVVKARPVSHSPVVWSMEQAR